MPELPLSDHTYLREDGTVFPPVTPDVPAPPGYASPLDEAPGLDRLDEVARPAEDGGGRFSGAPRVET